MARKMGASGTIDKTLQSAFGVFVRAATAIAPDETSAVTSCLAPDLKVSRF